MAPDGSAMTTRPRRSRQPRGSSSLRVVRMNPIARRRASARLSTSRPSRRQPRQSSCAHGRSISAPRSLLDPVAGAPCRHRETRPQVTGGLLLLDATPLGIGLGEVDAAAGRGTVATYVNDRRSTRLRSVEARRDIAQAIQSAMPRWRRGMEAGRDTQPAARLRGRRSISSQAALPTWPTTGRPSGWVAGLGKRSPRPGRHGSAGPAERKDQRDGRR